MTMENVKDILTALPRQYPDPDGDVLLVVKNGTPIIAVRVSSHTLMAVSSVFKKILSSTAKEKEVP